MAVVINEFEIVPGAPASQGGEGGTPAEGAADGRRGNDVRREVDKHLRQRALRASRLRAI